MSEGGSWLLQAVQERFQIGIINPRALDGVLVDGHRFLEPFLRLVQSPQLGAVTGEVVRDRPHLGERVRHGQQLIEHLLRLFEFMQGEGAVNLRVHSIRVELDDRIGNVHADIPFLPASVNAPAKFQHIRVRAKLRRDTLQFLVGLQVIPKLQPALHRSEMMTVWC